MGHAVAVLHIQRDPVFPIGVFHQDGGVGGFGDDALDAGRVLDDVIHAPAVTARQGEQTHKGQEQGEGFLHGDAPFFAV